MELPKGPPFHSITDAYEFAYAILHTRRSGRSNTPDRDKGSSGSMPKDYQVLDAITIWARAEACDLGDPRRPSWFMLHFMPPPTEERPRWTSRESHRLGKAIQDFECLLCDINFIPDCGGQRGKGCRKRKNGNRLTD